MHSTADQYPHRTPPVQMYNDVLLSLPPLLEPLEQEVLAGQAASGSAELAFLAGHLTLLGFEIMTQVGCPVEDRRLAADVAWTFGHLGPDFRPFGKLAEEAVQPYGLYFPVRLSLDEVQAAAHRLISRARLLGVPLPEALQENGLAWALVLPQPPVALARTPEDLLPRRTSRPERVPREQRLLARHAGARTPHEEHAAALLLYINARDSHIGMPVLHLLGQIRRHLLILKDLDPGAERALRPEFMALHEELGRARLPRAHDRMVPRTEWETVATLGQAFLRQLRSERVMPLQDGWQDQELWRVFDVLDEYLQGEDAQSVPPSLRFQMVLYGTIALTRMFRAPGMPLHPLAELATDLVGIDPYWAWQDLQPEQERRHMLPDDLEQLAYASKLVLFAEMRAPHLDAFDARARKLFRAAAGHVLAVSRRWNIRLPEHAFMEQYLGEFGPLRASVWTPQERDTYLEEVETYKQDLAAALASLPEEATVPADAPLGAEPPPAPEPETVTHLAVPAHVTEARALLEGKRVTLLGGVPRPAHHAALVRDLGLAELDWVPSEAYQHGTHAAAHVPQDTAVVILAVRWMGHAHNALRDVAREQGVPYVMHPGGLNPSSVAYQVLRQVSEQLRAG